MKKRVLLVDDEPRVRASLKAVLEPSYEILEAADAGDGLQLFKRIQEEVQENLFNLLTIEREEREVRCQDSTQTNAPLRCSS